MKFKIGDTVKYEKKTAVIRYIGPLRGCGSEDSIWCNWSIKEWDHKILPRSAGGMLTYISDLSKLELIKHGGERDFKEILAEEIEFLKSVVGG